MRGTTGGWRRRGIVLAAVVGMVGLVAPARAGDGVLPEPCKLHEQKVLNPGCVPAVTDEVEEAVGGLTGPVLDPPDTYPDLMPTVAAVFPYRDLIAFDPETGEETYGPLQLGFDTWSQNVGDVALDLLTDEPTNTTNPRVSQCVSWAAPLVCRERREVGGFEMHFAHDHFHFLDFARYELRRTLPDGTPDYSEAGLVGLSDKVSFCLFDAWEIRDDAPERTYTSCGGTREGISPGWADIYDAGIPGQQFEIEGFDDGRYVLIVDMDYGDRLWETDNGNNVVEVTIELSNGLSEATIVDRRWP